MKITEPTVVAITATSELDAGTYTIGVCVNADPGFHSHSLSGWVMVID